MSVLLIVALAIPPLLGVTLLVVRAFKQQSRVVSPSQLKDGVPALARILAMRDTGVSINRNPQVEFQLEVQPEGLPPYQAQAISVVSRLAVPQYQPGATLKVLFDPKSPDRVAIIGP